MAETAVGLFDESTSAERVASLLRTQGFSADAVRLISKPLGASVTSSTSTPSIDFGAGLAQDLRSMGATDEECEAYVSSVQAGSVLMFVAGTTAEADYAASLMNENDAVQIEEFAGTAPMTPSLLAGNMGPSGAISLKEERTRTHASGARVFTW